MNETKSKEKAEFFENEKKLENTMTIDINKTLNQPKEFNPSKYVKPELEQKEMFDKYMEYSNQIGKEETKEKTK